MPPRIFDRLKSLPLTIALSILIWMYAEAKFTATQDNVRITLKPVSPQSDLVLRAFDPGYSRFQAAISVLVTIEGPKNEIDRVYQESLGAVVPEPGSEFSTLTFVPPAGKLTPGADNTFDTVEVLNRLPFFRQRGITVTAASPPRLQLEADQVERLLKPVEFHPTLAVQRFTATPDQVTVLVPSVLLQQIGGADKITVTAVPTRDLSALPPDSQQTIPVHYTVEYPGPRDDRISVLPVQGTVTAAIPRRQAMVQVLPDIPVWVSGPPALLARYSVDVSPKFVRVAVSGTAPAVRALQERLANTTRGTGGGDQGIRAYLDISLDDRPSDSMTRRRVRYSLPEGLTVQDAPAEVEFRLVEPAPATPASSTQPLGAVRP